MDERDHDPQVIRTELNFLLRRYARTPNLRLARHIYAYLLRLLPHLDQVGFVDNRCGFYKLLKTWQLRSLPSEHQNLETVK